MIGTISEHQEPDNGRPRFVFTEDVTGISWNCSADAGFTGGVPPVRTRVRLSGQVTVRSIREFLFSFTDITPID